MTAPSGTVRRLTYTRDGFACVECGSFDNLQWGHRESSGHGGRGVKAAPVTPADGVTQCAVHNQAAEAGGQARALRLGHKIRRNRGGILASQIPYYDSNMGAWYLPDIHGQRVAIIPALALELLVAAGSIGIEVA
jgi:hypothetical protein